MIRQSVKQNIQSVLIALFPILGIYNIISGLSIGIVLLLISSLLMIKTERFNFKIIIYFISLLFLSLISFSFSIFQNEDLFINNTLQIILMAFLCSYYTTLNPSHYFRNTLLAIGVFSTIVIIFQFVSFYLFNLPITFYLPIGELMKNRIEFSSIYWGRPASFFLEPAHYTIYILPIFYYTLINNKIKISLFLLLGIFLSTSTSGFVIAIFLILYHVLFYKFSSKYFTAIIFVGIIFLFIFDESVISIVDHNLEKLNPRNLDENIRILGTLPLLKELSGFSLLFGLGHNQLSNYMSLINIDTFNYASSFLMSIFSFGILSLFSLWYLLSFLYRENKDKGYFFIFLFTLLSDQILFNQNFLYLLVCIYLLKSKTLKSVRR